MAIKPIDDQPNDYSIGNSELTFESNDIYVDGVKKFKITKGLMELLTQSSFRGFTLRTFLSFWIEDNKNTL